MGSIYYILPDFIEHIIEERHTLQLCSDKISGNVPIITFIHPILKALCVIIWLLFVFVLLYTIHSDFKLLKCIQVAQKFAPLLTLNVR